MSDPQLQALLRELARKCPTPGPVYMHPADFARWAYELVPWWRRAWWQLTNPTWRALVKTERMDARRGKARELKGSENSFRGLDR